MVAVGQFVEAGGDRAELFEASEAALDDVAVLVELTVEGRWPAACRMAREEYVLSAMTASGRQRGRPAPSGHSQAAHDGVEDDGVVDVAGCDDNGQGQAPAVAGEVDLRGQSAAGPTECLVVAYGVCRVLSFVPCWCPCCTSPGGMLVRAGDGGATGYRPLHRAGCVLVYLDVFEQLRPGAVRLPAGEAFVDGLSGAVAVRHVPPGCAGSQAPQHAVDDLPVVPPWPSPSVSSRQQGRCPLPRRFRQFSPADGRIHARTRSVRWDIRVLPGRRGSTRLVVRLRARA